MPNLLLVWWTVFNRNCNFRSLSANKADNTTSVLATWGKLYDTWTASARALRRRYRGIKSSTSS